MLTITEICAEIRNYFTRDLDKHIGVFNIENGQIVPSVDIPTDYVRIVGSRLNDGVHRISDNDLVDEPNFKGAVWVMTVPNDFLKLVEEISAWCEKNETVESSNMSPYTSESFGGYSYSKASGTDGSPITWQAVFKKRLNLYRRIKV